MKAKETGDFGENRAAEYLESTGYKIAAKNYHTRYGEIDIVACNEQAVCFCEVKTRKDTRTGTAGEAVNAAKQKKICLAALEYMQKNGLMNAVVRFDVIEVYTQGGVNINHIINAFDSSLYNI